MRFVWAIAALITGALLIAGGISQRTIFSGPQSDSVRVNVEEPAPYMLIDGDILRLHPGVQNLEVNGPGNIFVASVRTSDAEAWLADQIYHTVTVDQDGEIAVERVDPIFAPTGDGAEEPAGVGQVVRDPEGSDLWLDSYTEQNRLSVGHQLPDGMSLLIADDGAAPAPSDVSVTWRLRNSTPLAGPLIVAGSLIGLFGLVLYILAVRQRRGGRGPRRKGTGPLPPTEAMTLPTAQQRKQLPSRADEARSSRNSLGVAAIPMIAAIAVIASGCSADSWPRFGEGTPTPSPTQTVIAPENQQLPAVTRAQAERILLSTAASIAEADAAMDAELAATRMEGLPLQLRTTDYTLRAALPERAAPPVIPTDTIEMLLPEASDAWPRTIMLLSKNGTEETVPPVIMTMTQDDPWSKYRITEMAEMQPNVTMPELAPDRIGTTLVPADSPFMAVPPSEVAARFADAVDNGEASPYYASFDDQAHTLMNSVAASRADGVTALANRGAAETTDVSFAATATDIAPVSLASLSSGAIIGVSVIDTETITPTDADAFIQFNVNPEAETLTGVTESASGVRTQYAMQLFFSVPGQGSSEPIRLLAVRQELLSIEVIS